jgi:hypothetical protein
MAMDQRGRVSLLSSASKFSLTFIRLQLFMGCRENRKDRLLSIEGLEYRRRAMILLKGRRKKDSHIQVVGFCGHSKKQ